jgi:hypothetical protein
MKTETVEVKREKQVVATIEVPQFESIDEAVQHFTPADGDATAGESAVLKLINRQHKTDLSNRERVANAEQSTESKAIRVLRGIKKGDVSKDAALAQLQAMIAELQASAA